MNSALFFDSVINIYDDKRESNANVINTKKSREFWLEEDRNKYDNEIMFETWF